MNEKLRELAIESGMTKMNQRSDGLYVLSEDVLEKYGHMIVDKCIEQLELVRKYRYDRVQLLETQQTIIDECQYQIKTYFGAV